jgi:cytoskeleton protein RodZ
MFPAADEPPIKRAAKQELGRELHSGYGMMRYVTWGILFSLVALVAFWWLTRVDLEEPIPIQSQEQAEMGVEESPVDRFVPQSLPVEQDVVQTNASSQPVVEESEQALGEIEAAPSSTDQLLPPQGESPAPSAADVQPVQPATPPREVAPTRESEPAQESEPQVAAGTESKRVLFVFSEPCWTEVRDQNGKLRIFGEIGSGRERVLDSRLGPFSILLGNAAGVRLSIGGELFDLKPFTRGKVARFTLDPDRL